MPRIISQWKCYIEMNIIVVSSSLRLVMIVILGDFGRPPYNAIIFISTEKKWLSYSFCASMQPDISYVSSEIECLATEVNLYKTKWITKTIFHIIWWISAKLLAEILLTMTGIGAFNSETSDTKLRRFCDLYKLKSLVRERTCFKNTGNPLWIDLLLTNCSRSFQDT